MTEHAAPADTGTPTPALDLDWVRGQFPAFSEPSLEGFSFFENAGGSFPCGAVVDRLHDFYRRTKVQPYYGFEPSRGAGEAMDGARVRLASWMNATPEEVQIGPSTTQHTYVLGQAFRETLRPGDEVIVTNQDHEANIGAWRRLEAAGMVVREWRVDPETAELDGADLEALLNERTKLVAFTHASNIVGSINPVREWTDLVRAAGAVSVVDGVSYAPHGIPDVRALGADVYLYSLYKVYGPHQGVMFLDRDLNERLPNQGHFFNAGKPNARFVPAGPDHAQVAAVNGVLDYFDAFHRHHAGSGQGDADPRATVHDLMREAETTRLVPLLAFLRERPGVRIIGRDTPAGRAPTVSIRVQGKSPDMIAAALAERRIGIGNGNCYAWRLMEALDIPPEEGVARLSFVHYTSPGEIQRLVESLDEIL